VHVIIDDSAGPTLDVGLALGWTLVSDDGASAVIHVSYANAVAGLSYGGIDAAHLPKMSVDAIVAPALGRTLAHEIGHCLPAAAATPAPPGPRRGPAASTIPRAMVSAAIDEAAAIWRVPGVPLVAEIDQADVTASPIAVDRQSLPRGASLRVIVEEGAPTVKN